MANTAPLQAAAVLSWVPNTTTNPKLEDFDT